MQQGKLPFGGAAAAAAPAAATAAATVTTAAPAAAVKYGTLEERHPKQPILRKADAIMHLARNWETRGIVPLTTINTMNHPQKNMISKEIKPILDELGKGDSHFNTTTGQFRKYFESSHEPVRCWEKDENGEKIEALIARTVGDMNPTELKTKINDSYIGKLNKFLAILTTYVQEEMDPKHRCAPLTMNHACALLIRADASC